MAARVVLQQQADAAGRLARDEVGAALAADQADRVLGERGERTLDLARAGCRAHAHRAIGGVPSQPIGGGSERARVVHGGHGRRRGRAAVDRGDQQLADRVAQRMRCGEVGLGGRGDGARRWGVARDQRAPGEPLAELLRRRQVVDRARAAVVA
jgi:hypothetical protein